MSEVAKAVGVAMLFAYLIHYIISLASFAGKLNAKYDEIYERWKKLYLFGIFGLMSIHVPCIFSAIFAWIALAAFAFHYCSLFKGDEENRKAGIHTGGLIYMTVLTIWWIGETAQIFTKV